ncbi:ATP-binding protein [Streptomyces poonensis]|uniref:ATPase n=1 Tax=Streptomyces poonensis TaxID=68255 RepID=A0A918UD48_9ACTN|nr:ATP-binding protein [Streptomyces poonensis]GGY90528.1 ATPase [Streptomyces poonensis]GLJ87947.1 ATPase [Streptomyces poonensis]
MVTVAPSQHETPEFWSYALHLPYDPRAARIARRTLRAVLAEYGLRELIDSAELLASELVSNAYRHSEGPSGLRLRALGGGRLRMSVWDANPHIPPPFDQGPGRFRPVAVPPDGENGRGLFLVSHYADDWGARPLGDDLFGQRGKLLWCELGAH